MLAQLVQFLAATRQQVSRHRTSGWVRGRPNASRVKGIIAKVLVGGSMELVAAAFGHDVDDTAHRAPVLSAIAGIDDSEFLHWFLPRRVLLDARGGRDG